MKANTPESDTGGASSRSGEEPPGPTPQPTVEGPEAGDVRRAINGLVVGTLRVHYRDRTVAFDVSGDTAARLFATVRDMTNNEPSRWVANVDPMTSDFSGPWISLTVGDDLLALDWTVDQVRTDDNVRQYLGAAPSTLERSDTTARATETVGAAEGPSAPDDGE